MPDHSRLGTWVSGSAMSSGKVRAQDNATRRHATGLLFLYVHIYALDAAARALRNARAGGRLRALQSDDMLAGANDPL